MAYFHNSTDINQTFIIEPLSITGGSPTISACTTIYSNVLTSCSGDTTIFMGNGIISFDGNIYTNNDLTADVITATTFYSGGTNLLNIINSIQITGGTFDNNLDKLTLYKENGGVIDVTGFTDYYTTGTTLVGNTVYFDRNDLLSAYTLDLSSFAVNTYTTGLTFNNNEIIITRNDGISLNTFINTMTGLTVDGLLTSNEISANTVSATTFYGDGSQLTSVVKHDTYVTGGTYSNGTAIFTNNTGGTFNVSGFFNSSDDIYTTGLTFNPNNYNLSISKNDGSTYVANLAILATDMTITGGTYDINTGVVTFTNNTGGTFNVSGFTSGMTDSYTTSAYLSGETIYFNNNIQGPNFYNVNLNPVLDNYVPYSGATKNVILGNNSISSNVGFFVENDGSIINQAQLANIGEYLTLYVNSDSTYNGTNIFEVNPSTGLYYTKTYNDITSTLGFADNVFDVNFYSNSANTTTNQFYVNDTDTFSQNGFITNWNNESSEGEAKFGYDYFGFAKQLFFIDKDKTNNFNYSAQTIDFICNLEEGWGTSNYGFDFNDGTLFGSTISNSIGGAGLYTRMGDNNISQVITTAGEVALTNLTNGAGALMDSSIRLWKDYTQLLITNEDTTESNAIEMYTDRTYTKKYITTDEGFVGDYIQFNTGATETIETGKILWSSTDGTFDMGLLNGVTLKSGQETYIYVIASGSISKGDVVQYNGIKDGYIKIVKAIPSYINIKPDLFIGVANQDFNFGDFGYVTVFGQVKNINTLNFTVGSTLYYDSNGPSEGLLTDLLPNKNNAQITVAVVEKQDENLGVIFVNPHIKPKLENLQNVDIVSPQLGDILTYDSNTQTWINISGQILNHFNYVLTNPVSYSGSAAEVEVLRLELPPYTFAANDMIKIPTLLVQKTGTVNTYTIRVKLSTSATMPSTTTDMIATYTPGNTTVNVNMVRTWFLSGGILRGLGTSNSITDTIASNTQLNVAFDHNTTNYLYVSIDSAGASDTQTLVGFQLTNR